MSWKDRLRPASFRGVPFLVDAHEYESGRRVAEFEFPYLDTGYVEDLGKRLAKFQVEAFVLGEDYDQQRDALAKACCGSDQVGTLVHPYLGQLRVRCAGFGLRERRESGGIATFRLSFVEAGVPPSPTVTQDTASGLLAGIAAWLPVARAAFTLGSLIASNPGVLLGFASNLVESVAGNLLNSLTALPASIVAELVPTIEDMAGDLLDGGATADAFADAFQSTAAAIVGVPEVDPTDDPVTGYVPATPVPADPSYGLAALAEWGSDLPPAAVPMAGATALQPNQMLLVTTQQQIVDLVRDNAVIATLTVYAQTDWPSANAASAARDQVIGWIDERTEAAADAGNDALMLAWSGIGALAIADLTQRIQSLPILGSYATRASLSSLALAQLLYLDPTRADELAALNDVIHPAFMSTAGQALAA